MQLLLKEERNMKNNKELFLTCKFYIKDEKRTHVIEYLVLTVTVVFQVQCFSVFIRQG